LDRSVTRARSRHAAVRLLKALPANDACDQRVRQPPNSPQLRSLLLDARSMPAATRFPTLKVQVTENNLGKRTPFFEFADALLRRSCRNTTGDLRIPRFLTPVAPIRLMCIAASSCPRRTRPKETPLRGA